MKILFWGSKVSLAALTLAFLASCAPAMAQLKPFELAYTTKGEMAQVSAQVKDKLAHHGFDIVGSYSPYDNVKFSKGDMVSAEVIAITNAALEQAAAQTDLGGYGAVQRVTITRVNDQIEVAYTNPTYMANAYRMKNDLSGVQVQLANALGAQEAYGSQNGLSASALQSYHYKILMPHFTDQDTLAQYGSYQQALQAVHAGLAAHKAGVSKVYEVAIPGKEQTVIGVALSGPEDYECGADALIMSFIDFQQIKSTGFLPYEILVSGGKVYAQPGKFRIAVNFPDLGMMGPNGFMSISCAPEAIEDALKKVSK
jgi:ABC-type amino acid transport substrate-binding protein